jgi:hypothetical protein
MVMLCYVDGGITERDSLFTSQADRISSKRQNRIAALKASGGNRFKPSGKGLTIDVDVATRLRFSPFGFFPPL